MSQELNVLFDAALWPVLDNVRAILYQVQNSSLSAPCLLRNTDGGDRWSLLTRWFQNPSPERCAQVIRLCAADPELDVRILAVGEWERATLLADHFRQERVFLVGDAAHRVTPAGAFGMNTSIQSAHNLAWKLAAVLQGWGGMGLLDSYEAERRPWAAKTVELSYRLNTQGFRAATQTLGHVLGGAYETGAFVPDGTPAPANPDPIANYVVTARPGCRAPHAWLKRQSAEISTVDLFDGRFALLSRSEAWCEAGRSVAAELAIPLRAEILDDAGWAATYDVGSDGAVLVRPDGYVAWRSSTTATDSTRELHRILASTLNLPHRAMAMRAEDVVTAT